MMRGTCRDCSRAMDKNDMQRQKPKLTKEDRRNFWKVIRIGNRKKAGR